MRHRFYTIGYGMTVEYMVEFISESHLYIIEISRARNRRDGLDISRSEIEDAIQNLYHTDLEENAVREVVEKLEPLKWSYKKIER